MNEKFNLIINLVLKGKKRIGVSIIGAIDNKVFSMNKMQNILDIDTQEIKKLSFEKRGYFLHRIFYFFVKISGNMPVSKAKDGVLEIALKEPILSLERKEIIAIYPEGRMTRKENEFEKGRRGVSYLSLKTGVQILPVSIRGSAGASSWNFLLRRNRVFVSIGKPFLLPKNLSYNNNDDLVKGSDMVMNKIKELYYGYEN